ncbi:hypothetical protein BKA63DRAFT_507063 [Paraphoma chrysanthemicola]|nr:hypothetical protein BKA63DRAFT_507063 [Paraphoma chrysanthemicola]
MPASTPTSVSRYRPAILILAGAAAGYAAYLIYNISQAPPSDGLHRSNAVRRPNARTRRNASQVARVSSRLQGDLPVLGELHLLGARIPFNPHSLVSRGELRALVIQHQPDASPAAIEAHVEHVYAIFLERLLMLMFPHRAPSSIEAEAITRWVADRYGDQITDSTAVATALQRHAASLPTTNTLTVDGAESVANTEQSWDSDDDTEGEGIDPDGQTLQRTLYHIAEDRARQEGVVHRGITCNGCDEKPIRGIRWHCANCADYDLCSNCEATNTHIKTHIFYKIRVPAPYLGTAKQEPLYPGKPHMMMPSIGAALKKRLVTETRMEAEEIDALWDQFTCLAGTEWLADPNSIGWALDRRAFNHAFIPRYNSFVAAPNLVYDRIFSYYDSDKNGLIGFEEWIKGLDGMHSSHIKSKIVFNAYDVDGDGYISRKDILRIFRAYYAIEKEATRNYVAEITEELSVRNALDTIRSSQPLGSAFPPHGPTSQNRQTVRLQEKARLDLGNSRPVLNEDRPDIAEREEMITAVTTQSFDDDDEADNTQDHAVSARWSRRQFYVDEEEGMMRPAGVEDDASSQEDHPTDQGVDTQQDLFEESGTRPRYSRSSSRVRFEDDVDVETRSNASTSSRPVNERWGGYEIPEPEKDLGKEILYQVTQQGFNELLDPLFEDRENDAMDAHATRAERRQCPDAIDEITHTFNHDKRRGLRAICMVGIFRYSECIVEMFCDAVNKSSSSGPFKQYFHDKDGKGVCKRSAKERLLSVYSGMEDAFLKTISVPSDYAVNDMSLWNTWVCQEQLRDEVLVACLEMAAHLGWMASLPEPSSATTTSLIFRDPTMPQFRPNSSADLRMAGQKSFQGQDSKDTDSYADHQLSRYEAEGLQDDNEDNASSQSKGPFFVEYWPKLNYVTTGADAPLTDEALKKWQSIPSRPATEYPVSVVVDQPPTSIHDTPGNDGARAKWQNYKNDPVIHALCIHTSNGTELIEAYPRPVVHTTNPYYSGENQLKPLYQLVREVAAEPASPFHGIWLASLEAVQQENHRRKGNGLIDFEEFDEHMREGKMRFLESWMEWVSI